MEATPDSSTPVIDREETMEIILTLAHSALTGASSALALAPIPGLDKAADSLVFLIEMVQVRVE